MNRFVDAMIAQVGIPYPTLPISMRCIFIWQRTNDPTEQMNKFGFNRSIEQMNNEPMITRTNDSRFNERNECAGCDHRPDAVHFHSPNPHLANRHSLGFPCHSLNPSFLSLSSILTGSAGLARITSLGFCALSVLTGSKEAH